MAPVALHPVDVLAGVGGNAAHALHQVQDDTLAGENDTSIVTNDGNGLVFLDANPIEDLGMVDDFKTAVVLFFQAGVDIQEAGNTAEAGDDALLLHQDGGRGTHLRVNRDLRGDVIGRAILEDRLLQNRFDAFILPVHFASSLLRFRIR